MSTDLLNPTHIKLATRQYLEEIQDCANLAYQVYIERIGKKPAPMCADFAQQIENRQVYIACANDTLVGYIVSYEMNGVWHIENVAVNPKYSGKGLGKRLIAFSEQLAMDKGHTNIELYTNEAMVENLTFYPKLGYMEIKRKQQDGFNRVFFRKMFTN